MKQISLVIVVVVLFLCCMCMPAGATLLEVTVKGTVATLSPSTNTITIDHLQQYGCSYPASGVRVCTYKPDECGVSHGNSTRQCLFLCL